MAIPPASPNDRTSLPTAARAALVTGAGRRVGATIARALGAAGWDVALHFHASSEGAAQVAGEIAALGRRAALVPGDLSQAADCVRVVERAIEAMGRLDLLVCSAASFERVPFEELSAEAFDRAMALNARAPLLLSHAARAALRSAGGSVVIVTCVSATLPYPNFVPYVVSKGAARQVMRTLAIEMAPEVRVNAVAPGTVLAPDEYDEQARRALAARTLVERLGSADDVAHAVLYLADARFVTGHEILVDGGVALAGRRSGEA